MRRLLNAALLSLALAAVAAKPAAAQFTYVGSWAVADGPRWSAGGVQSMSGRQTAAFLFGGAYTDYAISTNGNNVGLINFRTFLDGYGDTQYLTNAQSQDFVQQSGAAYSDGPPAYSAYVFDHACGIYYCAAGGGENARNYAFRVTATPEPASMALLATGLVGVAGVARKRRRS